MVWLTSLIILLYWLFRTFQADRRSENYYRRLFFVSLTIVAVHLLILSGWQFFLWRSNDIARFLVPPHNTWNYFVFYVFSRFWLPYLVSGIAGWVGFWLFGWLNKIRGGRFFFDEELYFFWAAVFLSGHPGWILYLPILLIFWLPQIQKIYGSRTGRISFYYLWLPAGIAAVLLNQWFLISWEGYWKLLL